MNVLFVGMVGVDAKSLRLAESCRPRISGICEALVIQLDLAATRRVLLAVRTVAV